MDITSMSKKSSQSQVFDKVEDAVFTFRTEKKTVQGAKGDKEEERLRERNKETVKAEKTTTSEVFMRKKKRKEKKN